MRSFFLFLSVLTFLFGCRVLEKGTLRLEKQLNRKGIFAHDFKTDSLNFHYWRGGSGPVILFLHGFGGDALLTWRKELIALSKTHTVIAPDLLWFGKSTAKLKPDLASQRQAVEVLFSTLGLDSAAIVGQSYGGFLALDLAVSGKIKTNKLLIANSPGTTFHSEELDKVRATYQVKNIDELFVFDQPELLQRLINLSTYSDPKIPAKVADQIYKRYFSINHDELRGLMRSLPFEQVRFENPSVFRKFDIMVLWGEKDELFPLSEGKLFADSVGARFAVIPKCGHAPQMDDHRSFLKLVLGFLR